MSKLTALVDKSITKRLERIEARLKRLETRPTVARTVAEITQDLGDQRAGRFIATTSEDGDPEDATFTGAFMSALMQAIADGSQARIAEVLNGIMQFGIGNGAAWFGAGAGRLNADGALFSQYGDLVIFGDEDAQRVATIGFAESGLYFSIKQWKYAASPPVELVLNGDFETGDKSDWATFISGQSSATVLDTMPHNGAYSIRMAGSDGGATIESVDYFTVSPSKPHLLRFWAREDNAPQADLGATVTIKFYTAGDVYISQAITTVLTSSLPGWRLLSLAVSSPATAAKAKLTISVGSATACSLWLDDISLRELELVNELVMSDSGTIIRAGQVRVEGTLVPTALTIPTGQPFGTLAGNGNNQTVAAGGTSYAGFGFTGLNANSVNVRIKPAVDCRLINFYIETRSAQPATGSLVIDLIVSGVARHSITIPAGSAAGVFSDTVTAISVTAASNLNVRVVNNASGASAQIAGFSIGQYSQ